MDKQAEYILNHPLIREFFEKLHAQLYQGLKKAKTDEGRQELATYGRFADEFEQFFRAYIETGKLAELRDKEQRAAEQKQKELMAAVSSRYNW